MAEFNTDYITVTAEDEVAATPRSLKTIIEAELGDTLPPGALCMSLTIQNHAGAGSIKISHLADPTTHYLLIPFGTTRSIVPAGKRIDLDSIFVKVAADSDNFSIECFLE